jgi:sugar phosphate isomerase/epimerase
VLVCGADPRCDLEDARQMVADGIAAIAPYAAEHGVRLGIEPLHPMFAADRSVIVTLAQALDIAATFDRERVGIIFDVYHTWWDPDLYHQIERAGDRIMAFHISDWIVPTPDLLLGRGMIGDGVIAIRRIHQAVTAAGYSGPIEVEIFNRTIWDTPGDEVLARIVERFPDCVA